MAHKKIPTGNYRKFSLISMVFLYVVQGMEDERTIPDERSGMSSNRTSYGELAKNFGIQNQLGIRVYE